MGARVWMKAESNVGAHKLQGQDGVLTFVSFPSHSRRDLDINRPGTVPNAKTLRWVPPDLDCTPAPQHLPIPPYTLPSMCAAAL